MTVHCFHWNNGSEFKKHFRVCWFGERHRGRVGGFGGGKKMEMREMEKKEAKEKRDEVMKKEETAGESER